MCRASPKPRAATSSSSTDRARFMTDRKEYGSDGGEIGRLLQALADELESVRRLYEVQADIIAPLLAEAGIRHSAEVAHAIQQHDLIVQEIEAVSTILSGLGRSGSLSATARSEDDARLIETILASVKLGRTRQRISDRLSGRLPPDHSSDGKDEVWD